MVRVVVVVFSWLAVVVVIATNGQVVSLGSSADVSLSEEEEEGACNDFQRRLCRNLLQRECVVGRNGGVYCAECTGLLRATGPSAFAECCKYNARKMRCGTAQRGTSSGVCMRSEELFVKAWPNPKRATVGRDTGKACGRVGDMEKNGLACRIKKDGGIYNCIDDDGSILYPCFQNLYEAADEVYGEQQGDRSGSTVAISANGNRMAVGARLSDENGGDSGYVRVFDWESYPAGGWAQLGEDIGGSAPRNEAGTVALSADGHRLAVGEPHHDGNGGRESGRVRVFQWVMATREWVQLGEGIDGESERDFAGSSVAMSSDGNRLAVGAASRRGPGQVRVFEWKESSAWVQMGATIDGNAGLDLFGEMVSMSTSGDRLAVVASGSETNRSAAGYVRVLEWQERGGWVQLGESIDGVGRKGWSSSSVALSGTGDRVAIGAPDDRGAGEGYVRVFEWNKDGGWIQLGEDIEGRQRFDGWGESVAISADGMLVAAGGSGGGRSPGHVGVFMWQWSRGWVQFGGYIEGESESDELGDAVAISGDDQTGRLVVGVPGHSRGSNPPVGKVRTFEVHTICA